MRIEKKPTAIRASYKNIFVYEDRLILSPHGPFSSSFMSFFIFGWLGVLFSLMNKNKKDLRYESSSLETIIPFDSIISAGLIKPSSRKPKLVIICKCKGISLIKLYCYREDTDRIVSTLKDVLGSRFNPSGSAVSNPYIDEPQRLTLEAKFNRTKLPVWLGCTISSIEIVFGMSLAIASLTGKESGLDRLLPTVIGLLVFIYGAWSILRISRSE